MTLTPPTLLFSAVYDYLDNTILPMFAWPTFATELRAYRQRCTSQEAVCVDVWPAACCLAAGGEVEAVIPVTAVWVLYIFAGRILDDLADGEGAYGDWQQNGRFQPVPTALYAIGIANQILAQLPDPTASGEILRAFFQTLTEAAAAEGAMSPAFSKDVERYSRNTAAKTGCVFATGAWAGVRAGIPNPDPELLTLMHAFGANIGMMIQIKDDCDDLLIDLKNGMCTLPVIYGMSQTEHPRYGDLCHLLQNHAEPEWITAVSEILLEMDAINWSLSAAAAYQIKAFQLLENSSLQTEYLHPYVIF